MKKIVVMLVTVLSIHCLIGCGSNDTSGEASNDSQQESTVHEEDGDTVNNEASSDVTESTAESTSEVATGETPAEESTSESTTVVYEGIDMESTLPGVGWVQTFVGVIEEPKVVVFSDETGRKEIVEEGDVVKFNPDVDLIGVYLPEGYKRADGISGIVAIERMYVEEHFEYFKLEPEETRDNKVQNSAIYVECDGEKTELSFVFVPE